MKQEVRKKMRSRLVVRYYSIINIVDEQADTITGTLYAVTDQSNEIPVYQTEIPVARSVFMTEMAKLETALAETWYELPVEIIDDEAQG